MIGTGSECKFVGKLTTSVSEFLVSIMTVFIVLSMYIVLRDSRWNAVWMIFKIKNFGFNSREEAKWQHKNFDNKDNPIDELLPTGFDTKSCRSRFESTSFRHGLSRKASPHLISRLRRYEALHKKCGPYTDAYNKTVENLKLGRPITTSDCKYVIWLPFRGLGNRIITIASAFLYALLTNRVLLIDRGVDLPDLFCEPFPETSWLLPLNFPLVNRFNTFNHRSQESYGSKLQSNSIGNTSDPYMFVYLAGNCKDWDRHFYCDQDQMYLQKTPWLIMKSDLYFATYLFLMPYFNEELNNLFPDKEDIFPLLARYLFHPTNSAWDSIASYYRTHLSTADFKVGIQVRIFDHRQSPFRQVFDEILSCTIKKNILPRIGQSINGTSMIKPRSIAVLITSLSSDYSNELQTMYANHSTVTGERVSVYQPSHEGNQKTDANGHNIKAWEEMYLLSMMDKLVTSSQSTFGYVAQGLGGLQPWILNWVWNGKVPDPPCQQGVSREPCFHSYRYYDCKAKKDEEYGNVVPYVRRGEDVSWGFKLFPFLNR